VRLLRPHRAVHSWSPLRVRPLAATPQPKQHLADCGVRGNVRRVPGNQCPLAPLPVLLHVCMLEGRLSGGDDRVRQSSDEAGPERRLHPVVPDQLKQRLVQGVVLPAERP
jgi:hypothetical protein